MRSTMTMFLLVSMLWASAQSDQLIVRGVTGNLYLDHAVVPKETWYSVGRLYNIDPRSLARYNHQTFSHPLDIGQLLRVPLTTENFSQNGRKLGSETLVPVYHIVQEKEWLYRISVNHNKVPIPALEKWNHVTGDEVHAGLHMIVGYLKVKTASSALARRKEGPPSDKEGPPSDKEGPPSTKETPAVAKAVMPPAGAAKENDGQQTLDSSNHLYREQTHTVAARTPSAVQTPSAAALPAPHFNGGKFKDDYNDGGHSVTGEAGVFKSTSGWQDGKYYALINDVPVGTIVRITDQSNGRKVYAKVLGQLPDMKESTGLTVRLSNAAAAELGEPEGRFGVGVSY